MSNDADRKIIDTESITFIIAKVKGLFIGVYSAVAGKADKVLSATSGNFAGLDSNGNLTDSGKKSSDFATGAQGAKADSAIQSVKVNGTALTPDSNNAVDVTKTSLGLNNLTNDAQVKRSEMGTANGVASLDANGLVPASQLPSYVDDVLEYASASDFPATGETGKIYVDVSANLTYRWSGTTYTEISPSIALGETSSTAYRGDRGKTAYDHSQLTSGNPHNVRKSDLDLGNVDNKSAATLKSEFTGSVASGDTGFPTGNAVFNALDAKGIGFAGVATGNSCDDITAIRTAGKIPYLVADLLGMPAIFYLVKRIVLPTVQYIFGRIEGDKLYTYTCVGSTWTLETVSVESVLNKVTDDWQSTPDDTHYPSEKLVKDSLDGKVDKVSGKGLSTNDYTTTEKTKLSLIADGATKVASSSNGKIKINGTDTTVYTHPTTAGNKHVPSGGSSNQYLKYSSDGTVAWANPYEGDWRMVRFLSSSSATTYDLYNNYKGAPYKNSILLIRNTSSSATITVKINSTSTTTIPAGSAKLFVQVAENNWRFFAFA